MQILRVFNNNVVLARDELGREVVLTGRGLGFQARPGSAVREELIARRFVPADNPDSVGQVLADIPPERLRLVEELFAEAVRDLGATVPALAVVAVADHVHQAIERVARGEPMVYPLRAEVAHLHPQELAMAERLLARLNERLGLDLPQGEAIALAMHLFHAVTGSASMAETFVQSALIGQIFDTLARAYGDRFDPASIDAARFAAHLRYFFARARTGTQLDDQVGAVGSALQARSPRAYQLAQRLRALLEMRLDHTVSDDEVVYLALHLTRLESGMSRARA
ncbi:PRD domain-containing protein [Piscicoccus intestinalis]|uniref:PRD domain-containing protein n=1 Tax=Piscicoccus intestinalis TaxID=746033 RepID=UPI000838D593|nr:PRD domain-containing protein [Piscicoccus intestinalis]